MKKRKTNVKWVLIGVIFTGVIMVLFGPTNKEMLAEHDAKIKMKTERKKEQIVKVLMEVKKIPAKNYEDNYFGYKRLVALDPENKNYIKKLAHYKARYKFQEDVCTTCRIEARKKNKASLNNPQTYKTVTYDDLWSNGTYYYQETFLGKNAFGVESKLISKFECTVTKDNKININKIF